MLIFTVTLELDGKPLKDPKKEDLSVSIECPGEVPRTNIMGGSGGSYHVGFKPFVGGQHWIDFKWRDIWAEETFQMPVKDKSGKVPNHPYTGTAKSQAGGGPAKPSAATTSVAKPATTTPTKAATTPAKAAPVKEAPKEPSPKSTADGPGLKGINDLDETSFTITAIDASGAKLTSGGHKFEVEVTGPQDVTVNVSDKGNGTYEAKYGPVDAGEYTVEVKYNGTHITGSPFTVEVEEEITGGMLSELDVLFVLRGKDGDTIRTGGAIPHLKVDSSSVGAALSEPEDGVYSLNIQTQPGHNFIDVDIGGKSVEGFPLEIQI